MVDGGAVFFLSRVSFYEKIHEEAEMEVEFAIVESVHSYKAFASRCVFRTYAADLLLVVHGIIPHRDNSYVLLGACIPISNFENNCGLDYLLFYKRSVFFVQLIAKFSPTHKFKKCTIYADVYSFYRKIFYHI